MVSYCPENVINIIKDVEGCHSDLIARSVLAQISFLHQFKLSFHTVDANSVSGKLSNETGTLFFASMWRLILTSGHLLIFSVRAKKKASVRSCVNYVMTTCTVNMQLSVCGISCFTLH